MEHKKREYGIAMCKFNKNSQGVLCIIMKRYFASKTLHLMLDFLKIIIFIIFSC